MESSNLESSPKRIQIFTDSSEPLAEKPPSPKRVTTTSRKQPAFGIATAKLPHALHQSNPPLILLSQLAEKLGVEPRQLLPLIEHQYLKLVSADPPTVYEPPPAACDWLSQMLLPIPLRPFLTIDMIATIEGLSPGDVRRLCVEYDTPVRMDPVFGELLSVTAYYSFHANLYRYRDPSRFDRQAMIVALLGACDPRGAKRLLRPRTFELKLEDEIRRIVRLDEPARTDAALRLWEAYEDGMKVSAIIAKAQGQEVPEFRQMRKIAKMVKADDAPIESREYTEDTEPADSRSAPSTS